MALKKPRSVLNPGKPYDLTHNVCGFDTHTLLLGDERDAGLGELNAEEGGWQAAAVKLGVLVHRQGHEEPAAVRPGQLQRQAVLLTQVLAEGFFNLVFMKEITKEITRFLRH